MPLGIEQNAQGFLFLQRQPTAPRRSAGLGAFDQVFEVRSEGRVDTARSCRRGSCGRQRIGWLLLLEAQHQLFLRSDQPVQFRVGLIFRASRRGVALGSSREFSFELSHARLERLHVPFRVRRARLLDRELVGAHLARVEHTRGRGDQRHETQAKTKSLLHETPVAHVPEFTRNPARQPLRIYRRTKTELARVRAPPPEAVGTWDAEHKVRRR